MKKTLTIVLFLALPMAGVAQTMRYFEFRVECGGMEWRDTSFIAAASDPELIEMVLDNIERPFNQRNFIVGSIDYGHGGLTAMLHIGLNGTLFQMNGDWQKILLKFVMVAPLLI
jgi:hypothetical protein